MSTYSKNYSRQIAVNKRIVEYKGTETVVFDVWSMIGDRWQSVANAMSPRLIKEFFGIEVTA